MPWPIVSGLLDRLSTVEYRRHYHTALAAYLGSFGGMQDKTPNDLMAPWARPDAPGKEDSALRLNLPDVQAQAFRLGLRRGVVSQRLLNIFMR